MNFDVLLVISLECLGESLMRRIPTELSTCICWQVFKRLQLQNKEAYYYTTPLNK